MKTPLSTLALGSMLLLSACSGNGNAREMLGLSRGAPDEMRVVSHPPLSVPPDFRLPQPGWGEDRRGPMTDQLAAGLVLGEGQLAGGTAPTAVAPVTASALASPADSIFLQKAGVMTLDPNIRQKLSQSAVEAPEEEQEGTRWWAFGRDSGDRIVDPMAEAQRVRTAKEAGQPVTGEGAATTTSGGEGLLDQLF